LKIAYVEMLSGVSGELLLGALVDSGVKTDDLVSALGPSSTADLAVQKVRPGGITATQVRINTPESREVSLSQAREILASMPLATDVAVKVERTFLRLAEAHAASYGIDLSAVRLEIDALIEIALVLTGFHLLGVEQASASEICVGKGKVQIGETRLSPPEPLVARLLIGFRITPGTVEESLVSPVGAALIAEICDGSAPMPSLQLSGAGFGAGNFEIEGHPHILRILTGHTVSGSASEIVVIESQIDDMVPEAYDILMEDAFRAGALDVMFTPVQMKRNRPGTLVTVLSPVGLEENLARLLLRESTTVGVRLRRMERRVLHRESVTVETKWGQVQGKVVWGPGIKRRFKPEYTDCRRLHEQCGVPFLEIASAARRAFDDTEGNTCPS